MYTARHFQGVTLSEIMVALWTGSGQCIKFNDNVRCAKEPMEICIEYNDNVRCLGGWVKEQPVKARRCEKSELFR